MVDVIVYVLSIIEVAVLGVLVYHINSINKQEKYMSDHMTSFFSKVDQHIEALDKHIEALDKHLLILEDHTSKIDQNIIILDKRVQQKDQIA